jgi:hypothetical protein
MREEYRSLVKVCSFEGTNLPSMAHARGLLKPLSKVLITCTSLIATTEEYARSIYASLRDIA